MAVVRGPHVWRDVDAGWAMSFVPPHQQGEFDENASEPCAVSRQSAPWSGHRRVLVTGATGYVGGRIVPALISQGINVRCLARTPAKLHAASWSGDVEIVVGSVDGDLTEAMRDVDVAVYLVHSIGDGSDWVQRELRQAVNFATAAEAAGVRRIVYLGGLGAGDDQLSKHLASRQDVGAALAATSVPTIEIRAGVIIGSASASFEMLRYLVEVLPVMITPKWVKTKCQPIGIGDVVSIVLAAIVSPEVRSGVFEAGGADVVTYAEMMETYAWIAGLRKRVLIPVPLLTPRLSSHWVGLVTPVPVPLAKELVHSLVNEVIVTANSACEAFDVEPMGLGEAITRALEVSTVNLAPTTFSDADLVYFHPNELDPKWSGGTQYRDERVRHTTLQPSDVFDELCTIGGSKGWYGGEWLWRARGVLDQLVGGPGLRRGRKVVLRVGDALDFWRIEEVTPPSRLRLRAEMRLPGIAWLTWDIRDDQHGSLVTQTASFRPRGISNLAHLFKRRTVEQGSRSDPFPVPWFETHVPHTGSVHVRHTLEKSRGSEFGLNVYGADVGTGRKYLVSVTDDREPVETCHRYSALMTGIPTRWLVDGRHTNWVMEDMVYFGKKDESLDACPDCSLLPDQIDRSENHIDPCWDRRDDPDLAATQRSETWRKGFNFTVPVPVPHLPGVVVKIGFTATSSVTWDVTSKFPGGVMYQPYWRKAWRTSSRNFFLPERLLASHPWRGNVREAGNTIHRAVLLAVGNEIGPEAIRLPDGTQVGGATLGASNAELSGPVRAAVEWLPQ